MQVTIDLPDQLTNKVQKQWGNLSQEILRHLVLRAFKEGLINFNEFKEMLGFSIDKDFKAFLAANMPLHAGGLLNLAGSCADFDIEIDNLGICDEMDDDLTGVFDE
jgi:hypothetical protein